MHPQCRLWRARKWAESLGAEASAAVIAREIASAPERVLEIECSQAVLQGPHKSCRYTKNKKISTSRRRALRVCSSGVGAILRDVSSGVEWRLDRGDAWTVGHSTGCEVVLPDTDVGRRHLRIEFADGGWRVLLLADGAGAFAVNGIATGRDELRGGDVLRIGATLLRFEIDDRPPAADGKAISRREPIAVPQSFEALLTLYTADCPGVDAALVAARAGEALIRFCEIPERRAKLGEAFRAGLTSAWPVVRAVSAHGFAAIAATGAPGAGDALASLVDHPDGTVRSAAARALASVDPLAAAPRIHARAVETLDAHDAHDAAEYAAQLSGIGDESLLGDLLARASSKVFDDSRAAARVCAAAVLGELAAAGRNDAVRPLRTLLGDRAEEVRAAAVDALRRAACDEARESLRAAIADESPRVFQAAIRALSGSHDALLADLLKKALRATAPSDLERRARYRRALEDVTGERRGSDPDAWL